ncbi:MAG: hypothetical protein ABJE95_16510 [Byssovorax sp.]
MATRVGKCLSLVGALALVSGCAGSMSEKLREARTGAYVFHHPAPDVAAAARALLEDSGYQVLAGDGSGVVRTDWHPILDDEQFATTFDRYFVVVQRLSPQHCRIAAIRQSASTMGMEEAHPHSLSHTEGTGRNQNNVTYGKGKDALPMGSPVNHRDLDLEWKLIARAEPDRARLVESDIHWLVEHH